MATLAAWRADVETYYRRIGLLDRELTNAHAEWYARHYEPAGDNLWLEQRLLIASGGLAACIDRETIYYGCDGYLAILSTLAAISRGSFAAAGAAETWDVAVDPPVVRLDFEQSTLWLERRSDFASNDLIVELNAHRGDRTFEVMAAGDDWTIVCVSPEEKAELGVRGWRFSTPADFADPLAHYRLQAARAIHEGQLDRLSVLRRPAAVALAESDATLAFSCGIDHATRGHAGDAWRWFSRARTLGMTHALEAASRYV